MKRTKITRKLLRMHPLALIFWLSIIFIFVGLVIPKLALLIWIGCVVVALYIIYFATWLYQELP